MISHGAPPQRLWHRRQADLLPNDRFRAVNSLRPPAGSDRLAPIAFAITTPVSRHSNEATGQKSFGYSRSRPYAAAGDGLLAGVPFSARLPLGLFLLRVCAKQELIRLAGMAFTGRFYSAGSSPKWPRFSVRSSYCSTDVAQRTG